MTDVNETAKLLALCAGVFHRQDHLALDASRQAEACRELNEYGILSIRAISAVVGCSEYRVEQALRGLPRPTARGKLNPQHLPWLAYMLDGKVRKNWVECMLREGTSISTIHSITGIARSTLQRRK